MGSGQRFLGSVWRIAIKLDKQLPIWTQMINGWRMIGAIGNGANNFSREFGAKGQERGKMIKMGRLQNTIQKLNQFLMRITSGVLNTPKRQVFVFC